ncbi:TIGR02391 family protein [Phocaeicola dorei]|uniref:TIGR02391 family protein n=1 Tax=Phocaeicola dorei TaxID=357276 RepID=UPI00234CE924|nr:TIGR02391 family protein [Phocaeicola dorei]MDC7172086.1 TIGR02391 family protein [Phocaeicola dorei]
MIYFKNASQIEQLSRELGECVTGSRLDTLLANHQFKDDKIISTKWKRIHNAFVNQHNIYKNHQPIFAFIEEVLSPVNYTDTGKYNSDCDNISRVLRFIGYEINQEGKIVSAKIAKTISEAQKRADSLREKLQERNAHNILFNFCKEEFCNNDYFHAVQEAIKSILVRVRNISCLTTDGRPLIQQAFQLTSPYVIINNFQTTSERNEHEGFKMICEGLVSMIRNPTSHEAKIHWSITEQDALETLSMISFIHRKLDTAQQIRFV